MALRQRKWARKTRNKLRKLLGGKCKNCGKKKELEFDVIVPLGDHHHRIEWSWRMSFYRKQYDNDNLQLLCSKCNLLKRNYMQLISKTGIEQPF